MVAAELLLIIAAFTHLAPEHIARALNHSAVAWESMVYGIEASILWIYVGAKTRHHELAALAVWGLFESVQRPLCRALHPMNRPLKLPPGEFVCGAAGVGTEELSVIALCCVVVVWRLRSRNAQRPQP